LEERNAVNTSPVNPIDPELELDHIEQSFDTLGDWLDEMIIEVAEGLTTDAGWLLPKLDQCERRMDASCYLAYQLVWEFLPAEDLHRNYSVIRRLRRHRQLLLLNGFEPLRRSFDLP
jgi:hypothetical protein